MNIASMGIDLGKTTFHLVALGGHNKVIFHLPPKPLMFGTGQHP
jgi:hypothetical protein